MNKVLFGKEAQEAMKVGIDTTYKAVSATLGAAGKNSIYRDYFSKMPIVTNDGVSIAMMINLEDEAASIGSDMLKQSARRTNDEAGDGTTTNIILAKHIIDKGLEKIEVGANAMTLKKEIDNAVKKVVAEIKSRAKPIQTDKELFQIANLSMENPEVAQIVADAVKKVGENGTVIVEESNSLSIVREDIDGIKFDKGYLSPYMVTNPQTMEAKLSDVHVLVTDKSFSLNTDFMNLFDTLFKKGIRNLVMICDNMQGEALATIIQNRVRNDKPDDRFLTVVIQKPNDPDVLEDIAIATGAEVITNDKVPGNIGSIHFTYLGKAKKVLVTKDSSLIVGDPIQKNKIKDRIEAVKRQIEIETSQLKKDQLRERLAKLVGSIVVLKIGAPTTAEMRYLKMKVDDAVSATKAAMAEGIVIGGGKTLFEICQQKSETLGEEVVYFACQQLIRKIIENAGFEPGQIISELKEGQVWNALTGRICENPLEDGIIDPAKVERVALENAASTGGIFITSESLIIELPAQNKKNVV